MLLFGGLVAVSLFSRVHTGGYMNVLIPGYAGFCILFGISLAGLEELIDRVVPIAHSPMTILLSLCILTQCLGLFEDPRTAVPSDKHRIACDQLVTRIRQISGDVFAPDFPWLMYEADKTPCAHSMAILDVQRAATRESKALSDELARRFTEMEYKALLLSDEALIEQAEKAYQVAEIEPTVSPVAGYQPLPARMMTARR